MTKEFDNSNLEPTSKSLIDNLPGDLKTRAKGLAGAPLAEAVPSFIKASGDKVIEGSNNAFIVLTRDRPASRVSGYGGLGHKGCGTIDLVAGRMGSNAKSFDDKRRVWVDPDFSKDASRIYISQKTDADDNFKLAKGTIGNQKARAAIILKSDGIRVIGRQGIKLITGVDPRNSQDESNSFVYGIDLIAGNDDTNLQPIALGTNVKDAIKDLYGKIEDLAGIVDGLLDEQMKLNQALTTHFHISPFFGLPTSPSPEVLSVGPTVMLNHLAQTKRSIFSLKYNIVNSKFKYTNPTSKKYISSRYNNTN